MKSARPYYLFDDLQKFQTLPTRQLRSAEQKKFDLPLTNSHFYDESFQLKAITLWNNLPNNVTDSETSSIFKNRLLKQIVSDQNS